MSFRKSFALFMTVLSLCLMCSTVPTLAQRQGGQDKPADNLKDAKAKKGGKIKVAVIPQDRERQWTKDITVASLEDALVSGGRFAVLSRSELDSVMREQQFSNSDLVDPNAAVRIGKALAAQYVIIAKCVSLENKEKSGGFGFGGINVNQKTKTMTTSVQMQLIDTESTQIIESKSYTDKVENKSTQTSSGGNETDAPGQDAYRDLMVKFAKDFADRLSLSIPIEALVVLVKNNQVAIDAGSEKAVTEGLEFEVILEGEPIRDSAGNVLSYDTTKIGRIRAVRVEPKLAWCDVVETYDASGRPEAAANVGKIQRDYVCKQVAKAGAPPKKK